VTATIDNVSVRSTATQTWQGLDIGPVGPAGSQVETESGLDVTAGGVDIYGTSDAFRFSTRR
jgi:hypothetical protein